MRTLAMSLVILALIGCSGGDDGTGPTPPDVAADTTIDTGPSDTATLPDDTTGESDSPVSPEDAVTPPPDEGAHPDVARPDVPRVCPEGARCDDGDACTFDDRCDAAGGCAGEPYACSDGRPCTVDLCDGFGDCRFEVAAGSCLVNGRCVGDGETLDDAPCLRCDASADPLSAAPVADAVCDDGDPCTLGDTCRDGACSPGETLLDCEDGNPCTQDECIPGLGCDSAPVIAVCDDGNPCTDPDLCLDDGCVGRPRDCDDDNPCTSDRCEAATGCVHAPIPGTCDDSNRCTLEDACASGECRGGPATLACDDGNPCTYDVCDPIGGCLHANSTSACTDGNSCTEGDRCRDGECLPGTPSLCNDENECTDDTCDPESGCFYSLNDNPCCENGVNICADGDPCTTDLCDLATGGCIHEFNTAPCDDTNACTAGDACFEGACLGTARNCDDNNPCTADSCNEQTGCRHQPVDGACDDRNACTTGDRCQFGVCMGNFLDCSDTNECTDDVCDPAAGCTHPNNTAPCDDGDICTIADACRNGRCGGQPNTCDDGDPCTSQSCVNPIGCTTPLPLDSGPCDDGRECTIADHCEHGVCIGDDSGCVCPPPPGPAVKLTALQIIADGRRGIDLDGNPGTCAPPGQCASGIDNSMAPVGGLANPELTKAMQEGKIFLLMQHQGFRTDGQPYQLNTWPSKIVDESCAFQTARCDYLLDANGFTEDCAPLVNLTNATVTGNHFHAGGIGYNFLFNLPLMEGVELTLVLYYATIDATVTVSGGQVTSMQGILAGAVPKESIREAILAIPPDQLPLAPAAILGLIDSFIRNDLDTDGNGQADAASIALSFEGIQANIVGTAP